MDADGEPDPEEVGIPGVRVSNGVEVIETGADGSFNLAVVRENSRFVLLTVPRGQRATRGFYHQVSAEPADSVAFGLTSDPAADTDQFRFIHASDVHVHDANTAGEFREALEEMALLEQPADFVLVSGDLTNSGSTTQLGLVAQELVAPALPVHAGFGDHDGDSDSLLVRNFEDLIGPTYYSFDRGPYHFVMHNNCRPASVDGSFDAQLAWLANDIAAADGQTIYVCAHFMPTRPEIDLYRSLGVNAVFSGHWHANRMGMVEGILSINTGTLRMAGIDRSSPSFRVIDVNDGEIRASLRTGGIAPRVTIVDPPLGTSPYGTVSIHDRLRNES
jgi:predicted phosphodiesterase